MISTTGRLTQFASSSENSNNASSVQIQPLRSSLKMRPVSGRQTHPRESASQTVKAVSHSQLPVRALTTTPGPRQTEYPRATSNLAMTISIEISTAMKISVKTLKVKVYWVKAKNSTVVTPFYTFFITHGFDESYWMTHGLNQSYWMSHQTKV